jgi:hypothetical protein
LNCSEESGATAEKLEAPECISRRKKVRWKFRIEASSSLDELDGDEM